MRAADGHILTVPGDWALLSPGDAALTRRVKEAGDHWLVQEKKGRKVFSRGVWAPAATIERIRAELDAERSTERYAKKREVDTRRRDKAQAEYVEDFFGAVLAFLAFHPNHADLADRLARAVTDHATPVGSGTVARTKRIPVEQRAEAAVIAWMRHRTTGYDGMVIAKIKGKRREVRRMLAARSKELLTGYRDIGMDDKNKSYYRAVILGCVRCIDYLFTRGDFNKKELAVTGGSQGGALTLITSGLDPRVTLAAPNVAAMCDHSGMAFDRVSGWPHWLSRAKDKAKVLETSAYFDAVNFARKFKGKSVHGVGFIDTVCAPTTVYAAFNVHPEPKVMINSPLMGHGTDPRWTKAREQFFKDNMTLKPPTK